MLKTHKISIINCPESVRSVLPSLLSDLSQPVVFDSVETIVPFAPINLIFDSLSDAVSALETLSALRIMGKPLRLKPSFDPISMDLGYVLVLASVSNSLSLVTTWISFSLTRI